MVSEGIRHKKKGPTRCVGVASQKISNWLIFVANFFHVLVAHAHQLFVADGPFLVNSEVVVMNSDKKCPDVARDHLAKHEGLSAQASPPQLGRKDVEHLIELGGGDALRPGAVTPAGVLVGQCEGK